MGIFKKNPKKPKSNVPAVRGTFRGHHAPREGKWMLVGGKKDRNGVGLWRRLE